jgi:hypothetical protein
MRAMTATDLVLFSSSLLSALLGAALGGFIAYRSALDLTKRGEALIHEAVRRQLRDLLDSVHTRFTKLKEHPTAHFVHEDPAIQVLLERGFSTDSARSLTSDQGRLVQDAILRSVRVAAAVSELQHEAAAVSESQDDASRKSDARDGIIGNIKCHADDAIKKIDKALSALRL